MSTADIGLSPDPKNPLNDVSTMNKTMEYMAFELPVVAFDLRETRVSAGEAAVYVDARTSSTTMPAAIVELARRRGRRTGLGKLGRVRVEQELAWRHQERGLRRVSTTALAEPRRPGAAATLPRTGG